MKGESNSTEFYMQLLSLKIGCCSYNNSYASLLVATKKRPRVDMKKVKKKNQSTSLQKTPNHKGR